jgi:hypothetical protein
MTLESKDPDISVRTKYGSDHPDPINRLAFVRRETFQIRKTVELVCRSRETRMNMGRHPMPNCDTRADTHKMFDGFRFA